MRCVGVMLAMMCTAGAAGQRAELRMANGPYYTGVGIAIQITVEGFEERPTPTCDGPQPPGGRLQFQGLKSTGKSIFIVNGRQTVNHTQAFSYTFTADAPGRYRIGPFSVKQDGTEVQTRARTIMVKEVEAFGGMRLRMILPDKPVFIGQRVPIAVEWWVLASEQDKLLEQPQYDFSIPLFNMGSSFNFIDEPVQRRDNALTFATDRGDIRLKVAVTRETFDGQQWLVLRADRTLVPLQSNTFELGSASVTAGRIVGWQRDRSFLFPRRTPRYEKVAARDLERSLVVRELPRTGQPASFAGAVGRGFSLDVSADRTVVQVGDPITLTMTLRGEGNLDAAGLPPLDADGGLSPKQFSLPKGSTAGILQEDGSKVFTTKVRVRDDGVDELPGIAYSWFDADSASYHTTRSRPIALAVRAGEVVTARDAVGAGERPDPAAPGPTDAPSANATATRPTFTLTGADLSLATGAPALRRSRSLYGNRIVLTTLYGGSLILMAIAIVGRRRADVDPAILRRRKTLTEAEKRLAAAGRQTPRQAAAEIAGALRAMLAEVPHARNPMIDALLADCEVVVYAPEDAPPSQQDGLLDRATAAAQSIREAGA